MKKGDLVTVHPAACSLYLIVEEMSKELVMLYGAINGDWASLPMRKEFVEVLSESR